MAKNVSNRTPLSGNKRSHSCRATKHSRKVNLQNVTVDGTTVRMSAREIRSLKKTSAA